MKQGICVGIDASNIRGGGGLTHFSELLRYAQPEQFGIKSVLVWAGKQTLDQLPIRPLFKLCKEPLLDGSFLSRLLWQKTKLNRLAVQNCDVLFVPGGLYVGSFTPFVTMAQNLLPFEPRERQRYGLSWVNGRLRALEISQRSTFKNAAGVIFLTETAQKAVMGYTGPLNGKTTIIPHGVSESFKQSPRRQMPLSHYSCERPFRWLCVSIVDLYKHQWYIAEALAALRKRGLPVELTLVGPAYPPALKRLETLTRRIDANRQFIHYHGPIAHENLVQYYHESDGFIFASSCEAFSLIVLEAMASGLPIACSNRSAMPEILGDAGVYFDPESPTEIASALHDLVSDPDLRERCAKSAYERSEGYSWDCCARETFSFLAEVAKGSTV